VLSFLLAPNSFNNATTATGSVALRRPPSSKAVLQFQSYGKIRCPPANVNKVAIYWA
jgi:hypothetical protein